MKKLGAQNYPVESSLTTEMSLSGSKVTSEMDGLLAVKTCVYKMAESSTFTLSTVPTSKKIGLRYFTLKKHSGNAGASKIQRGKKSPRKPLVILGLGESPKLRATSLGENIRRCLTFFSTCSSSEVGLQGFPQYERAGMEGISSC